MNVGETFVRMALDSRDYEKGMARMEGYTKKKALTLGNIFQQGFSFALGIGLIHGFKTLGGAITDMIKTAAKTEMLSVGMLAVAHSSGYAKMEVERQKKAIMELGIADQEATTIVTRFMQSQLDLAAASKIARVAQDAGAIASMNSSDAAERMTEAIAKQRPELLNAFGFTRNLNDIYNDYAKTVGKTRSKLSETEKKQAMLNYILKEGTKIAGAYEATMGTVGKQLGSIETLELSKKLMQELKSALAMPLLLPAFSVWVEGVTNALQNAKVWVDENKAVLVSWGQTAANIAKGIIQAFKAVGEMFVRNWGVIKFSAIALTTYAIATRMAALMTTIFQIASALLKGELATNIPLLSTVSAAIGMYRVQMALAPVATNIFTGALYRLQAALYAVHTALGPIGWAIIGISLALTGGMALWNRYTQSLQKAAKTASPADMSKGFRDLESSTKKAADSAKNQANAAKEQADALDKAGKAAGKNLQSFDEIHQLQEDMAGAGAVDTPGLDLEGLDADMDAGLPAMDFAEMFADLNDLMDGIKPTLAGFWEWIKDGVRNISDWLKEKIGLSLGEIIAILYGPLGIIWGLLIKHWDDIKEAAGIVWDAVWELLKTYWSNLGTLAKDVFGSIRDFVIGTWENIRDTAVTIWGAIWGFISGTWENIKTTAGTIWGAIWDFLKSQWETIKTFGGNIFGILCDLITGKIDLRTAVKKIWNEIKKFFADTWSNIKTLGEKVWGALGKFFKTQWELTKTAATSIWDSLVKFFKTQWELIKTFGSEIWESLKKFLTGNWEATKKAASTIWTAIKNLIKAVWEGIKDIVNRVASAILGYLGLNWDSIRTAASTKWEDVKRIISSKLQELRSSISSIWSSITSTISNAWSSITSDALRWGRNLIDNFTRGIRDRISNIGSALRNVVGTVRDYLGFSSPTKLGPGRYADQWAPNLMKMYSEGLTANISMMQDAASVAASSLLAINAAGAGIEAGRQGAVSTAPITSAAPTGDIYVYIGNEQVDAYIHRSQDRRNIRSNGR